jgi:beta-lactamase class A
MRPQPTSLEAAAYLLMVGEFPDLAKEDIESVYRSGLNPSWASVRVSIPGEDKTYLIFLRRRGKFWHAEKSIRADEPNYPEYERVILGGVPQDLVSAIYPQNSSGESRAAEPDPFPSVEPVSLPPAEPVTNGVPQDRAEQVNIGLDQARRIVEGYDGIAGFYVWDPERGYGYGIRPDEEFFAASVIKIPLMVAVYRRIEEGRLSAHSTVEISASDWSGGAGQMQYEMPGTPHTIEEYLRAMMTESDNVAANALLRTVGGTDYVNRVARSLGAKNTTMYQKLSSERAVVPELDNRSTPRDMATILSRIQAGKAASPESCREMVSLMRGSAHEKWLEEPLPDDVEVADKSGWLYRVYDEAGIVSYDHHSYIIAVFSKHGPGDFDRGMSVVEDLSKTVWETQSGS